MSITLIVGRPGAGKSYEATAFYVLPKLAEGRMIVTNLPLNLEAFAKIDPAYPALIHVLEVTAENPRRFAELKDYKDHDGWRHPVTGMGAFFVIDECHKSIPAGNKNSQKEVLEWYAEHRHSSSDVLLLTQDVKKLHAYVKTLIDDYIVLSKNQGLGSRNTYRRSVRDGVGGAQMGNLQIRKYKKEYFGLYNTHTQGGGEEDKISGSKTIWSHWLFKFGAVFLVLTAYYIYRAFSHPILPQKKPEVVHEIQKPIPVPPSLPVTPLPLPVVAPVVGNAPPFAGSDLVIGSRLEIGDKAYITFMARLPDGRKMKVTPSELQHMGYKMDMFEGGNFFIFSYTKENRNDILYARNGWLPELPVQQQAVIDYYKSGRAYSIGGSMLNTSMQNPILNGQLPTPATTPQPVAAPVQAVQQPNPPQLSPQPSTPKAQYVGQSLRSDSRPRQLLK